MRTRILPKRFDFTEEQRSDITLSDGTKIQLDSKEATVGLVANSKDEYPLDTGLYVVTRVTSPSCWRKWKMILVGAYHVTENGTALTTHRVRLHNGTSHYYWDGAVWSVAGASDWNTETEVNAHIESFPNKTLGVVVNLATTDKRYTPTLRWINAVYEGVTYFWEDILYRSLIPTVRDTIRPISDFPIAIGADTSTIDLDSYPTDAKFNIVGVDSVFDHTADPTHATDLFSSYNPTTKVITLTSSIVAGNVAWVRFIYELPVILIQSQDYTEIAKVPAILIENFREVGSVTIPIYQGTFNRATGTGWKFPDPYSTTFAFDIIANAPGGVDVVRLQEEIVSFFAATPFITSKALDDKYRLQLVSEIEDTSQANSSGLRTLRGSALLHNVLSFHKPAEAAYPTSRLRLVGDVEADIPIV